MQDTDDTDAADYRRSIDANAANTTNYRRSIFWWSFDERVVGEGGGSRNGARRNDGAGNMTTWAAGLSLFALRLFNSAGFFRVARSITLRLCGKSVQ